VTLTRPGGPTRRLGAVGAAGLLAYCIHCGGPAPRVAAQTVSRDDDPRRVLQRFADEGEDPAGLAEAVLALHDPEISFVGDIPITFTRSDGAIPGYLVHPQGLAWVPETKRWAISAVEITRERDSSERPKDDPNGEGHPYVFFADAIGRLVPALTAELPVQAGSFHPGGIDAAGGSIFLSLSPYVPNSRADLLRLPIASPAPPVAIGAVEDHIGVVTVSSGRTPPLLRAASWDAKRWYTIGLDGHVLWSGESPLAIGFQDGQGMPGTDYVLWSGIVNPCATAFGFALIRLRGEKMEPARSIEWRTDRYPTPQGRPPLYNAAFFWLDRAHRIWVLAVPDDQHGRWRPRPHGNTAADARDVEDPEAGRGAALRLYRISSTTGPR
jgi:hypothetical protein